MRLKAAEIKEMMERLNTPTRVSSRRHEPFADVLELERRVEWVSMSEYKYVSERTETSTGQRTETSTGKSVSISQSVGVGIGTS